jgi:hypothetical protein
MIELNQQILKRFLHYDLETGIFTWIYHYKNTYLIGTEAGTPNTKGYIQIKLIGKKYLAQRLAFLYVNGEWPKNEVDHENEVKNDNSWNNLREATSQQNSNYYYCKKFEWNHQRG